MPPQKQRKAFLFLSSTADIHTIFTPKYPHESATSMDAKQIIAEGQEKKKLLSECNGGVEICLKFSLKAATERPEQKDGRREGGGEPTGDCNIIRLQK